MTDQATQSAINTLRNWRMRREAAGKPVLPQAVRARIVELWPETELAEMERIIEGVLAAHGRS